MEEKRMMKVYELIITLFFVGGLFLIMSYDLWIEGRRTEEE